MTTHNELMIRRTIRPNGTDLYEAVVGSSVILTTAKEPTTEQLQNALAAWRGQQKPTEDTA